MIENANRSAELLADIAEREARRDRSEELEMWRSPEPQRPRHEAHAPQQRTTDWGDWNRWCLSMIERALAERPVFSKAQVAVIAEALSEIRTSLKKEFAEQIAGLRADQTIDRAVARGEISKLRGEVPMKRRSNVA